VLNFVLEGIARTLVRGAVVGSCQHRASLERGAMGFRGMGEFGSFPVEATKGPAESWGRSEV
jgi:hypothetical protein